MRSKNQCGLEILQSISERSRLEEGGEGVKRVLREVFRGERVSTKKLAFLTKLPIPVVAAVRRELEKDGLLSRNQGAVLTERGKLFVTKQLGLSHLDRFTCPTCQGRGVWIPEEFKSTLEVLRRQLRRRPRPLTWLDQSHGTAETALLRALFMLEKGDIEGRKILFLGDDDLTSIAVGLFRAAKEVAVVDLDTRLLRTIKDISEEEDLRIKLVEHDLRKPLPEQLSGRYDAVFTDPPYTHPGLTLFLSRGIMALEKRVGAAIYLSFAHQSPRKKLILQRALNDMGLAIEEQVSRFNIYEGAEMFANTTFLARLETTENSKPLLSGVYEYKLYTGEITRTKRTYECRCGVRINVGATEEIRTIEDLKAEGCPKCSAKKSFKLIKREKINEDLVRSLNIQGFRWEDFSAILDFEREITERSFPDTPILDEEYHRLKIEKAVKREPKGLKVAVLNSEIVGWLWLRTERDRSKGERFGYIKSIIVKPEHRLLGFGGRLMEAAEEYFSKNGVRRIDLIVSASNIEASLFFEEMGFQREHSTMRKTLNIRLCEG